MNALNLWESFNNIVTKATKWFVLVSALSIGVTMLLATTDVISSKFFNYPIISAKDLIEEMNVIVVYAAIAYVQLERGHISLNVFEKIFTKGTNYALKIASLVLAILVDGFISWRALVLLLGHIAVEETKSGAGSMLLWPFSMVMFLGFSLLTIAFTLTLVKEISASKP